MNVGILGLGLIGGSFARAYAKAGHAVYACEKNEDMFAFAQLADVVKDTLNEHTIPSCRLIILSIYTAGSIQWLKNNAKYISEDTIVLDSCGIKSEICTKCFSIAESYGFTFVGGHPMAGSHFSGFKYSRSNMFQGAPMVLIPPRYDDAALLHIVKDLLAPCGFGSFSVTTAKEHDAMIAFTSQMPHIVSNAYIKSPTALSHKGFSAGSYKDLTRVAWLNPQMWAELFLNNKENLLFELDYYINSLNAYRKAISEDDSEELIALLDEGRKRKEEVDG